MTLRGDVVVNSTGGHSPRSRNTEKQKEVVINQICKKLVLS